MWGERGGKGVGVLCWIGLDDGRREELSEVLMVWFAK